jgi:hypothetical protein
MDRSALLNPWRIVLGLLPLWYAGFLVIELDQTFLWLGGIAAVLVVLLMLVSSLGYPMLACWPAFSALTLLLACGVMLYQGVPSLSAIPVTHSPLELWVIGFLAGLALIWAAVSTRRVMEYT